MSESQKKENYYVSVEIQPVERKSKMKIRIKIMISIVLASLALVFIIQNFAVTNIRFLFWTLSISSALLMFLLLLAGLIFGWFLHSYSEKK